MITPEDIERAAARISPYVLRTPASSATGIPGLSHCEAFLKMEQLQPTGSFKIRGATNKLLTLPRRSLDEGVIAASTGNHGAAVARAAKLLGGRAIVYVPENASPTKLAAIDDQGAEIRYIGNDGIEAETAARGYSNEHNLEYVSPYNDVEIVAGQGTIGLELSQQISDLSAVYVSVGGGGLISGIGSYFKMINPDVEIVGCSPENSAVMHHSIIAGSILDLTSRPTLSDGTAGGIEENALTFDICQRVVDRWLIVPELAIRSALELLLRRMHLKVEGSAALALAGLIQDHERAKSKRVAVVMCGGNISQDLLKSILTETPNNSANQ